MLPARWHIDHHPPVDQLHLPALGWILELVELLGREQPVGDQGRCHAHEYTGVPNPRVFLPDAHAPPVGRSFPAVRVFPPPSRITHTGAMALRISPSGAAPPGDGAPTLQRALGFWELVATGVGIIVGAGIYVLVGTATAEAGPAVWLAFIMAAFLSATTGLSYCELASMFPRAGAEYEYTRQAFPAWVAFAVGWVMTAALVIASGAVALGFARYLRYFIEIDLRLGALLLILVTTAIALAGIGRSARITMLLSAIQVGGLLLVISVGIDHVGDRDLLATHGATGLLGAAALVFFAFIGFDEVATLSEEVKNPSRTVPLALLVALAISTVLYVGIAIVGVSVLGADALGASERPLAAVMEHRVGGAAVGVVAAIALISTTNTTLLALTAASRMAFGMARDGVLPRRLARVSRRSRVPVYAILVAAVLSAAFAMIGDIALIAGVTDAAIYLVFLATNGTLIVLRFKLPSAERPFRSPLAIGRVPLLAVLGIASTLLMMTQLDINSLVLGSLVLAAGLLAGWGGAVYRRRLGGKPVTER